MSHEEFSFSSNSSDDTSPWKRNPLCSLEIRSKNIFCTHGTAILRINEILETQNPEIKEHLAKLQNQLFSIDHQKGELEKHVFQEDLHQKSQMLKEIKVLSESYERICDQIEELLNRENFSAELGSQRSFELRK